MGHETMGKRILVVDDEQDILWPLQEFLLDDELKTQVLTATSGEEALEKLARERVDLVITDIKMPGISGLDLLVEIKNRFPFTQVMVMTAFPSTEFKREALLKGGMHFVEKPFDIKAVREKVLCALRDSEQFRGLLSGISLGDVIQIKCMSGVTGALRVSEGERQGVIFFQDGEIIHALCDQLDGEEAFHEIMGFQQGHLDTVRMAEMPERTIFLPHLALLMEGSRRQDEKQSRQDGVQSTDSELPIFSVGAPALEEDGNVVPPAMAGAVRDQIGVPGCFYGQLLSGFRKLDGYRASAVVDQVGQALAEDKVDLGCNLATTGAGISNFFRVAHAGASKIGLERCNEAVLGTREEVVTIRRSGGGQDDGCFIIALFNASGNQARVKLEMKKIVSTINERKYPRGMQL